LASSRRVKKGPGRRQLSDQRRRFMELRERGWSVRRAAAEVGVSRSAGNNWTYGYKTCRNGVLTGFVPPLEPLAVREISARFLSQEERIQIADLRHARLSVRAIAERWGGHRRRSRESCVGTEPSERIVPSMRIGGRPRVGLDIITVVSTSILSCEQ